MAPEDYMRLLGFLSQHECHVPFRPFRMARAQMAPAERVAPARFA